MILESLRVSYSDICQYSIINTNYTIYYTDNANNKNLQKYLECERICH